GVLELAKGFLLLVLVLVDARGFFKNRAAILGMRAENLVDLSLRHQRVARPADARVHEQSLDVAEAAGRFVDEIFAIAVAMNAARDRDLGEVEVDAREREARGIDLRK